MTGEPGNAIEPDCDRVHRVVHKFSGGSCTDVKASDFEAIICGHPEHAGDFLIANGAHSQPCQNLCGENLLALFRIAKGYDDQDAGAEGAPQQQPQPSTRLDIVQ